MWVWVNVVGVDVGRSRGYQKSIKITCNDLIEIINNKSTVIYDLYFFMYQNLLKTYKNLN